MMACWLSIRVLEPNMRTLDYINKPLKPAPVWLLSVATCPAPTPSCSEQVVPGDSTGINAGALSSTNWIEVSENGHPLDTAAALQAGVGVQF